jgi:hypothetical protein
MQRFLPWMIGGLFVVYLGAAIVFPIASPGGFDLARFGRLPVYMGGRVMPMESVARILLLQVRGPVTRSLDADMQMEPTEWLLEVMTKPAVADARRIFPIADATVIRTLQLASSASGYYSFGELAARRDQLAKEAARIGKIDTAKRADWEQNWLALRNRLIVYERAKNTLQPNSYLPKDAAGKSADYDAAARLAEFKSGLRAAVEALAARKQGKEQQVDAQTNQMVRRFAQPYVGLSRAAMVSVIPPSDLARSRDHWENIGAVVVNSMRTGTLPEPVTLYAGMSSAFAHGKPDVFNREVAAYYRWLRANGLSSDVSRSRYEFFYDRFQPYVKAGAMYVIACLALALYWLKRSPAVYRSAAVLLGIAFVLQTAGLLFAMMIQGHVPVATTFAIIVLAGWIAALIGGCLERFWRNAVGLTVAAVAGITTITLAHGLAPNGLVALLRSMLDIGFGLAILVTMTALWFVSSSRGGLIEPVTRRRTLPSRAA